MGSSSTLQERLESSLDKNGFGVFEDPKSHSKFSYVLVRKLEEPRRRDYMYALIGVNQGGQFFEAYFRPEDIREFFKTGAKKGELEFLLYLTDTVNARVFSESQLFQPKGQIYLGDQISLSSLAPFLHSTMEAYSKVGKYNDSLPDTFTDGSQLEGQRALAIIDRVLGHYGFMVVKDLRAKNGKYQYAVIERAGEEGAYNMLFFDESGTVKQKTFIDDFSTSDGAKNIQMEKNNGIIGVKINIGKAGSSTAIGDPHFTDWSDTFKALLKFSYESHKPS